MANKGLVMDLSYAGTSYYLLLPGLIGFMELTFMRHGADLPLERLARLMSEYLHDQGPEGEAREFFGSRYPIARALVYEEHIPVTSRITPYEDARRIILWEKGRLLPLIAEGLKRRWRLPRLRRR